MSRCACSRSLPVMCALALALLGACAQPAPRGPGPSVSVLVLPRSSDGHVGAVVVHPLDGARQVVVDRPYVEASMSDSRTVRKTAIEPRQVTRMYARTLEALPAFPTTFLVYFVEGTEELNPDAKRTIDKVMAELGTRPAPEIAVVGHTDFIGSDQYNDMLSVQRAGRVKALMVRRGISARIIKTAGRGKREPLVKTARDLVEPKNRRVEIVVR